MFKKTNGIRILKRNIILIGPPGSGKGTQSEMFSKNGYHVISTGDLLRDQVRLKTKLGLNIKKIMADGKLVSDEIIMDLICIELNKSIKFKGIIFDGFPRNINQARKLKKIIKINFVIDIDTPIDLIMKRIEGRYLCSNCGKSYNKYFNKPEMQGICDVCKGQNFEKRIDDNSRTINNRIKQHIKDSKNIIKFYKKDNIYFKVDGSKTSDITHQEINLIIKKN